MFSRKITLFLVLGTLIFVIGVFSNEQNPEDATSEQTEFCSSESDVTGCTDSGPAKSRAKRFVRLPLLTTLGVQSRLIIPQIPV